MIIEVIAKIEYFIIFLVFWVLMFSFLFRITGNEIDTSDYPGIPPYVYYILAIFRNTIGDLSIPKYEVWLDFNVLKVPPTLTWLSMIMISFNWLIWIMNLFFMFIILMNLFIAIVSIAFEEVLERKS